MKTRNGVKETSKCPVTNIHVNSVENSYLETITFAHSAAKSTPLDHKDAPNAETQLKQDKSDAAVAD